MTADRLAQALERILTHDDFALDARVVTEAEQALAAYRAQAPAEGDRQWNVPGSTHPERLFAEWLNEQRMKSVSEVFHDIVRRYREALDSPVQPKGTALPAGWVLRDRSDLEPGWIDIEGPGHPRVNIGPNPTSAGPAALGALARALLATQAPAPGGDDPVGAVLVNRETREGVMFYSRDMIPDPSTIKDRFELVNVYTRPAPSTQAPAVGPVTWTDAAIMSLLNAVGDGPFGEEDVTTTRRFMERAEEIRAELVESQHPVQHPASQQGEN